MFDGHGSVGHDCAIFCRNHLPGALAAAAAQGAGAGFHQAMTRAHVETNERLHKSDVDDTMSGTTSVSCVIRGKDLHIFNVGDSRAIIAHEAPTGGRLVAKALSYDQTPYRKDERERCKAAGARIMTMDQIDGLEPIHENFDTALGEELDEQGDPPRVWALDGDYPGCAFTRSFGDREGERIGVFAEPEITVHELTPRDRLVVLASDGVFEFLTNQQVIDLIADFPNDPLAACRKVVAESYQAWLQYEVRADDITIIIIKIHAGSVVSDPTREVVSPLAGRDAPAADGLKPVRRGMAKEKKLQLVGDDEDQDDLESPLEEPDDKKAPAERHAIIATLKKSFLFQGLAQAQLEFVARSATRQAVRVGETVIKQGDIGDNLYIVADGAFEVRVQEENAPPPGRIVHTYQGSTSSGHHPVFGDLALQYKGTVRQATVTATQAATLWAISRKVYKSVCLRMSTRKELLRTLRRVEVSFCAEPRAASPFFSTRRAHTPRHRRASRFSTPYRWRNSSAWPTASRTRDSVRART